MKVETATKVEFSELVRYIAMEKGISYYDARAMVPVSYQIGGTVWDTSAGEWCKEVVAFLLENNIYVVEVYS